jgi:hypothetical protein
MKKQAYLQQYGYARLLNPIPLVTTFPHVSEDGRINCSLRVGLRLTNLTASLAEVRVNSLLLKTNAARDLA